eukprot:14158343-Heterocapsa_arctica.AAC.2
MASPDAPFLEEDGGVLDSLSEESITIPGLAVNVEARGSVESAAVDAATKELLHVLVVATCQVCVGLSATELPVIAHVVVEGDDLAARAALEGDLLLDMREE